MAKEASKKLGVYNTSVNIGKETVQTMSEEYGPDFITVTDEDGNEFELEHLDTLEYNGETYMAFPPSRTARTWRMWIWHEEYGLII